MDTPTKNIFEDIYTNKKWYNGKSLSGDGGVLEYNKPYLDLLNKLVKQYNVKYIMELGCGDFNLMKHFNFNGLKYFGYDIAESIINKNDGQYRAPNIRFFCEDIRGVKLDRNFDLILIKDVFMHMDNSSILQTLFNLRNHSRILVTNDFGHPKQNNHDIVTGGYRSIDINDWPFYAEAECLLEYQSHFVMKKCMMVDGKKMFPPEILN